MEEEANKLRLGGRPVRHFMYINPLKSRTYVHGIAVIPSIVHLLVHFRGLLAISIILIPSSF